MILFVHGVPDTPMMWGPLIDALGLQPNAYRALSLPGFGNTPPTGFAATKEAYADWLMDQIENAAAETGAPVHLVGHDWGALLALRAASLKPEHIASWCVSNALVEPGYRWHTMARRWQTPLIGEFFMSQLTPKRMAAALEDAGMPKEMAEHEAAAVDKTMRQCILKLYRSAKAVQTEWHADLENLPRKGLVFWGADDPYVPLDTATRFCAAHDVALHVEEGAGHWAVVERAGELAGKLRELWGS